MKSNVAVIGGFSGEGNSQGEDLETRDPSSFPSIISAKGFGASTIRAASGCILDGLTILGGETTHGGGIHCASAGLTLRNCIVREGSGFGGGLYFLHSTGEILDSTIEGNRQGIVPCNEGGGIFAEESSLTLERCTIRYNVLEPQPEYYGHGWYSSVAAGGGGIHLCGSKAKMTRSKVVNNTVQSRSSGDRKGYGAGIAIECGSFLEMTNCLVTNNFLDTPPQYDELGTNQPNKRSMFGSGIYVSADSQAFLKHCTVAGNESRSANPRYWWFPPIIPGEQIEGGGSFNLVNSVVWEPTDEMDYGFVNSASGDFRLVLDSVLIDSGTDSGVFVDLEGKPRPVDLTGYGNDGASTFDIGAFERQTTDPLPTVPPSPTPAIPTPTREPLPMCFDPRADVNEDGVVNCDDILIILDNWMRECSVVN